MLWKTSHSLYSMSNNLFLTHRKRLYVLCPNLENLRLHPGWQIMLMACMIYNCGVFNFLTEFTDQLHGSKELTFHLIQAERYEGYGLLKLHQMPNFQPWPSLYFNLPRWFLKVGVFHEHIRHRSGQQSERTASSEGICKVHRVKCSRVYSKQLNRHRKGMASFSGNGGSFQEQKKAFWCASEGLKFEMI